MQPTNATDEKSIDKRTIRAARESMTTMRQAPGLYRVFSGSKASEYVVDILEPACECPAFQYQAGKCKHIRRIEMLLGEREIPDLPGRPDVEAMIDTYQEAI
ncbi:SWIM zinc finger family protein [Halalkalicoccus sp. NIPERK01]|uniref:SWIM zinc finger family protein n=1 Tax=Halalkalicoccus sp. NIPERK01 TaxID=3053469 RepID=UPI00256F0738|nr:SWIM zinc finger family protein [Halalkalicoccus sp. NIPERK01]MDL5361330.1 SWIM zinc finger family protein [Halalkalicoccus sp. NIPERK01]